MSQFVSNAAKLAVPTHFQSLDSCKSTRSSLQKIAITSEPNHECRQGCAFACEIRKIRMRSENFAKLRIRIASKSPFRVRINFAKCENIFRMRIFRIKRNFAKCEYSRANTSPKANFRVRFLGELRSPRFQMMILN